MFVLVLLLSVYVLLSNLNGYRSLFTPTSYLADKLRKQISDVKEEDRIYHKVLLVVLLIVIVTPVILFYIIAANVLVDYKFLLVYIVLTIISLINSLRRVVLFVLIDNSRDLKRSFLSRALHIVNTLVIIFFIYYYTINLH